MKYLLYHLTLFLSRLRALFPQEEALHRGRFALTHEVSDLTTGTLPSDSLLLGIDQFSRIVHVRATPQRRELGNILIEAPTGGGKGLLAVCQLLTWGGSAIVLDLKGDLYLQTAGYRRRLGPVYRFDPEGFGHCFDPFWGVETDDKLYAIAHHLLYEPTEGEGKGFAQKGARMLMVVFLAGREVNRKRGKKDGPLFPFVGQMADLGLNRTARLIYDISREQGLPVVRVTVWETPTSWATYTAA